MSPPDGDAMRQVLVRHGESVSNAEGRVQGQAQVPLSSLGARQAAAVARWAAGLPADGAVDEVWSSPLRRARQTADVIAEALGLPVSVEERLAELHAGIFEGHLWADLAVRFPAELAAWQAGDPDYVIPGGESRGALAARGRAALESLALRPARTIVVVAHGGLLTAALGSLVGNADALLAAAVTRPFTRLPALANGSLTLLRWPGPQLEAFNDTGHLAAVASPGG
ncbi:MAG: histidine phosphatase family protein [Planctomycetota bacterium]